MLLDRRRVRATTILEVGRRGVVLRHGSPDFCFGSISEALHADDPGSTPQEALELVDGRLDTVRITTTTQGVNGLWKTTVLAFT
jgi:hypothetical protein